MLNSVSNKSKLLSALFGKKNEPEVLKEEPAIGQYNGRDLLDYYNANRPLGPQPYICYAPFKSLYFESLGNAVACCSNRTYVLGSYPEMSIRDIWFGKKADEFRELIKNNDLSQGCQSCHSQINSANFSGAMSSSFDRNKINANGYPSMLQFELSNTCNLECGMCSGDYSSLIRTKREKLPPLKASYDLNFVKQLEEFIPHLEATSFLGGEPFLIELYYSIWQSMIAINPQAKIKVQTNGTVLNNRVKDILEKGNFHISVSIDSLQKDTYETIRKNARFEAVSSNIRYFANYSRERKHHLGLAVTPMRQNWKELADFILFANELNASIYFNHLVFPLEYSLMTLSHPELAEIIDYLSAQSLPAKTGIEKANRLKYTGFLNQLKGWYVQAGGSISAKPELPDYYRARNMADFTAYLTEQINKNGNLSESRKKELRDKVSAKLLHLEKSLNMAFSESRMAKLNLKEDLTGLLNSIETMSVTDLVAMMSSPAPQYSYYARSYEDFKNCLREQINNNASLTIERKKEQLNNVSVKLEQLEKLLDVPFTESRMARLNLATDLTTVANHMEAMPLEELIKTSK